MKNEYNLIPAKDYLKIRSKTQKNLRKYLANFEIFSRYFFSGFVLEDGRLIVVKKNDIFEHSYLLHWQDKTKNFQLELLDDDKELIVYDIFTLGLKY